MTRTCVFVCNECDRGNGECVLTTPDADFVPDYCPFSGVHGVEWVQVHIGEEVSE